MVKRNTHFAKLQGGYLFPEVHKRKMKLLEKYPDAKLISLSIGDTTEPIPSHVVQSLCQAAQDMGTLEGYRGYGPEQGYLKLREKISEIIYKGHLSADEIFISDGAKCDIARLQFLFGSGATIAVQDPAYPVYVDTSVMAGQTGPFNPASTQYEGIIYMPCLPENDFFPDLSSLPHSDLIYFCSPNNPTGAAATRKQLKHLVELAKARGSIIIFDAAYASFIQEDNLPRSIYEIPGAKEVAIEINSFSKLIGFTGIRLSWSTVPHQLLFEDGFSVRQDWHRLLTTCFNGASAISQEGGIAALSQTGQQERACLTAFYMENTRLLKEALETLGYSVYGGSNAPYLWIKTKEKSSWDAFENFLNHYHIVTTPGSGFGPSGEGFIRFSAFSHREHILEAIQRMNAGSI